MYRTRRSSSTAFVLTAVGMGALLAYALASPRRRAALLAAGYSALDTGSRLANRSVTRLQSMLPEGGADVAATVRDASTRATTAAADTFHDAVDRASEVMHDVLARARALPAKAQRATREREREFEDAIEEAEDEARTSRGGSAGGAILAAAALGAGIYALQRYGAFDRLAGKMGGQGVDESGCIQVDRTIYIEAPIETVFETWSNYENFPRFMSNVQSVEPLAGQRSHWKVKGPAGIGVEWDAVTHLSRPNEIAWESEPGSTVQNEGRVSLSREGSGTLASVHLSYRPPAGALGDAVASLFGANPRHELEQDLNRMKQFIESRHTGGQPASGTTLGTTALP